MEEIVVGRGNKLGFKVAAGGIVVVPFGSMRDFGRTRTASVLFHYGISSSYLWRLPSNMAGIWLI